MSDCLKVFNEKFNNIPQDSAQFAGFLAAWEHLESRIAQQE